MGFSLVYISLKLGIQHSGGTNNNNNNNNNNGRSGGRGPWENQFSYYAVWGCTGAGEKETQTQVLWEKWLVKHELVM